MSEESSWQHEEIQEKKLFFKVGLEKAIGSKTLWIAIRAQSSGEALVIADARCDGTPFQIQGILVEEIKQWEYWRMLERC